MAIYLLSCVPADVLVETLCKHGIIWYDDKFEEQLGSTAPTALKVSGGNILKTERLLDLKLPVVLTDYFFIYQHILLDEFLNAELFKYDDEAISRAAIVNKVKAVNWEEQADRFKQVKTLRLIGID